MAEIILHSVLESSNTEGVRVALLKLKELGADPERDRQRPGQGLSWGYLCRFFPGEKTTMLVSRHANRLEATGSYLHRLAKDLPPRPKSGAFGN